MYTHLLNVYTIDLSVYLYRRFSVYTNRLFSVYTNRLLSGYTNRLKCVHK